MESLIAIVVASTMSTALSIVLVALISVRCRRRRRRSANSSNNNSNNGKEEQQQHVVRRQESDVIISKSSSVETQVRRIRSQGNAMYRNREKNAEVELNSLERERQRKSILPIYD